MTYAKFILALSAALGVAVSLTVDGTVSLNDALAILAAAVGALAVGVVPNKPSTPGGDGGFADGGVVWTLVGILAIFALVIWISRAI